MEILKSAVADLNAQTSRGATAFHYIQYDKELNYKGRDLAFLAGKRFLYRILGWIVKIEIWKNLRINSFIMYNFYYKILIKLTVINSRMPH